MHNLGCDECINPFTPESDQFQILPAASPETLHHTVWRTFHIFLRWKMIMLPFPTTSLIHFSLEGWENVLFELGSERVKLTYRGWVLHFLAKSCANVRILCSNSRWPAHETSRRFVIRFLDINPSTPKSDQFQISPAASPVILQHTVWRTWLFIAY